MAAAFFAAPEIALDDKEAQALAQAIEEVNRHYRIPVLSPEKAALGGLMMVAGSIYGPRFAAIYKRRKNPPRRTDDAPEASNVTQFPGFNLSG